MNFSDPGAVFLVNAARDFLFGREGSLDLSVHLILGRLIMLRLSLLFSFALMLSTCTGCGDAAVGGGKAKTVPFSGKVTIDGKPAGEMSVQFLPKSSDGGVRSAYAQLKPDGTFSATTYITGDGIVPGSYTVKAGKEADVSSTDPAAMMAAVTGTAIESIDIQIPAEGLTDVEIKLTTGKAGKNTGGKSMLGN